MSLFQCDVCGCVENTACSDGGNIMKYLITKEREPEVYESYRQVLGLKENEEFGNYCCVCNPVWFNNKQYGIGKNPNKKEWHNRFERIFLPKGEWETNPFGNLQHKITGEEDYYKYAIKSQNAL